MMDGGWKPHVVICPPCPRCGSSNTKFCYYNNYSLTQPRYFCKGCRRYWTRGGSLRNVPFGGGCRKSRRGRSVRTPATCSASRNNNSSIGGNIDANSSNSAIGPNVTNIDLAQVYANFLNQRPHESNTDDHHDQRIPQLPSEVDSPFEFDSIAPNLDMAFGAQMSRENGMLFECENFSGRSSETYLGEGNGELICGFNSIHSNPERVHEYFSESTNQIIGNQELPPLPGEELEWTSSNMVVSDHILPLGFPPEGHDPVDQLIRHRSMFDMPNYEVLFKP